MSTLVVNGVPRSPQGMRVAPQSYAKLEEVAKGMQQLLPITQGTEYNLDCVRILEHTLLKAGFNFSLAGVEELDECAAFTIPEKSIVVVRSDIYEDLHAGGVFGRSTIVHEMAHIVLKHHVTLHRGAEIGKHKFYEDSEWQAKALTAAMMMPLMACEKAENPKSLAELCGTSFQAATFRLDNLRRHGLIKGQRMLFTGSNA